MQKDIHIFIWGFPSMGVPQELDGSQGKILLKWMIWGYPYFRKPSYIHIQDYSEFIQSFYACCLTSLMSCCSVSGFSLVSVFLVVFLISHVWNWIPQEVALDGISRARRWFESFFDRSKDPGTNINQKTWTFLWTIYIYTLYTHLPI